MPTDDYFAGFFDGEGSVGYYRRELKTQTVNTNRPVLDLLQERFGGHVHARRVARAHHTPTFCHVTTGGSAYDMLQALRPHLVVKAERVADILQAVGSRPGPGNRAKERCVHGHPFTPENTRIRANGNRECRQCDRDRARRRRKARS